MMEMYLQSRSVDMFTDQAKETYTKEIKRK